MIQLSVDTKVGMISVCSNESNALQFTMMGLLSSTPHVIFAFLRALREQGRVVRLVSPMYVFAPKMSVALYRTCHELDLCLGLSSRRSCRRSSDCRSTSKNVALLKTLVSRCHLAPSNGHGPLAVMTEVVPWNVVAVTPACEVSVLSGLWWNWAAPTFGG